MEYYHCSQSLKPNEYFGIAYLEKNVIFIRKFANFAITEFWKISFFFTGSRSCSNQTKVGMEYHHCVQRLKQKEYFGIAYLEKNLIFVRKFANFAITEF